MKIKTASLCDKGGKAINDDSVYIQETPHGICVFVGDGLGGYSGGKMASEAAGMAVLSCCNWSHPPLSDEWMLHAAQEAEQAVQRVQQERKGNMKTTLVVFILQGNQARWMHIGDSRLYHFVNRKLYTQTKDHSVSQMAVMMGEIDYSQIRFHEDRNRILRALGGEKTNPELSPITDLKKQRHAFLLCSDGFWEYVYESEMEQMLRLSKDPQDWLNKMEALLKERVPADNDNYTAAAIFADNSLFSLF